MGGGTYVPFEPGGATEAPGVYVADSVTDLMGGLPAAQASGVAAAAAINADLVNADADEAVARRRSAQVFSVADEALVCERVLGDRPHGLDSMLPPESGR